MLTVRPLPPTTVNKWSIQPGLPLSASLRLVALKSALQSSPTSGFNETWQINGKWSETSVPWRSNDFSVLRNETSLYVVSNRARWISCHICFLPGWMETGTFSVAGFFPDGHSIGSKAHSTPVYVKCVCVILKRKTKSNSFLFHYTLFKWSYFNLLDWELAYLSSLLF